jgi:DAHL domain
MKAMWKPLLIVTGLLLVLTYMLIRSASPDPVRHEKTLQALHALTLHDAELHRDVLQARAGLLRNYDPLVEAITGLYGAVDALRAEAKLGSGEAAADVGQHLDRLAVALVSVPDEFSLNVPIENSLIGV